MGVDLDAGPRAQTNLARHGEPGWYEWALRELLRYFFSIAVLAMIVFVPLQMEFSWLPSNAPAVLDPSVVSLLAILAIGLICIVAVLVYQKVWGDGGWVERSIARHREASRDRRGPSLGP